MEITVEELLNRGWEKELVLDKLVQYRKTINGFHYDVWECQYNNWYKWRLHIDNPDFESVAGIEVNTFEHIDQISQIYCFPEK